MKQTMKHITIKGVEYPRLMTMGAMLQFKQETGKELSEVANSLSDLVALLYCCVASASRREKQAFDMSLMDFADNLEQEDFTKWADELLAGERHEDAKDGKKKASQ
jgi:hypothetical protein